MPNPVELLQAEAKSCNRCKGETLVFAQGEQRAYPLFQKTHPGPFAS